MDDNEEEAKNGSGDAYKPVIRTDEDMMRMMEEEMWKEGKAPLWLAAWTGNLKMTKLLVDACADTMIRDHNSLTPLDVAIYALFALCAQTKSTKIDFTIFFHHL
jgi:hypothetical protein